MNTIDRVVVITDDVGHSGGAAVIALSSVKQLCQKGVPVTVFCGDDGRSPELAGLAVEVVPVCATHIMDGSRAAAAVRGLYNRGARALLDQWIGANDTDRTVYHLHNWHKMLSPSVFFALRKVERRLLLSTHDYFLVCPNGSYFHFPGNKPCSLPPLGGRCLAASCDKRHYGHKLWRVARQGMRSAAIGLGNTRATIVVVHDAMIPLMVRGGVPSASIRVLRNPVAAWCDARVPAEANSSVFFVGRLEIDKGVGVLANAAKLAGASLKVVGDGPLRAQLAAKHPDAQFLGQKSRSELAELMRGARMLVLPSLSRETFGLVAVEALLSGVPVIISRAAPISQEIEALGIGITTPPGDVAALADAIGGLLADDDAIRRMSERAMLRARTLAPTHEQWANQLAGLYRTTIEAASWPQPASADQARA